MLELPESQTLAKQINETLKGKTVLSVVVEKSPHRFAFYSDYKESYGEMLVSRKITGAERLGGILAVYIGEYMLYFTDGASPRYWENAGGAPEKHQLLLTFKEGGALSCSVQMYGCMYACRQGECTNEYYLAARSAPDIFGKDFTYDYFRALYKPSKTKLTLKAFLATEQRIPGLGNGVLQDILFNAGYDPRFDMADMSEAGFRSLYACLKDTLGQMCEKGGRSTERDLFGVCGGYRCKMCKNTLDSPCPKCGGTVQKAAYMGGTVYFCPRCQKRS